jgi:hypothetical protein
VTGARLEPCSILMRAHPISIVLAAAIAVPGAARAEPGAPLPQTVRARVIAPFSTWASYRGALRDGYSVAGAGVTFTIEHRALVVEAGVRTDYFSSAGYGAAFDVRIGARLELLGQPGHLGLDAVALAGVRHLRYTGLADGFTSSERVLFATGAVAIELSRRIPHQRFTGRVIACGLRALTGDVHGPDPISASVFATETGVEAGVELGVAF